jgi:Flp pilus assembly pilin Flp
MLLRKLIRFLKDEQAQDLIEYTLLLGFVALVTVGLMSQASYGVQGIWGTANSTIAQANSNPAGTPAGGGSGGHGDGHGDGDGH